MINPMEFMGAQLPQPGQQPLDPASQLRGLTYEQLMQFNQPFMQQLEQARALQQAPTEQYTDPLAAALGGLGGAFQRTGGSAREAMILKDMQKGAADQVTAGLGGGSTAGAGGGQAQGMAKQALLAQLLMGKGL